MNTSILDHKELQRDELENGDGIQMTEELAADQFGLSFDDADIQQQGEDDSEAVGDFNAIQIDPIERRGSLLSAQNMFGSFIKTADIHG